MRELFAADTALRKTATFGNRTSMPPPRPGTPPTTPSPSLPPSCSLPQLEPRPPPSNPLKPKMGTGADERGGGGRPAAEGGLGESGTLTNCSGPLKRYYKALEYKYRVKIVALDTLKQ
jgi:hypothetical protein